MFKNLLGFLKKPAEKAKAGVNDRYRWKVPKGHSTGINVLNSLVKETPRVPLVLEGNGRTMSWYTCGPTVYESAHLGHARAYVSIDIVQRILTDYFNYNVNHVMGMTDVDDKIIKRSEATGTSYKDLARKMELEFVEDMDALGVRPPLLITRVSENIPNIVNFIKQIKDNGFAYETQSSVLFDTGKLGGRYGKFTGDNMSPITEEPLLSGNKRDQRDFALWKSLNPAVDSDGVGQMVAWDSPFGEGRPGWHIECSSMIHSVFGSKLDVHAGGIDLKFPHHENEIAQCEAHFAPTPDPITGEYRQWANYFLHVGHLNIRGQKMSKSLKNFLTIREYLATPGCTPATFRWMCLVNRYFEPINYTKGNLQHTDSLNTFNDWFVRVETKMDEPINIHLRRTQYETARPLIELFNMSRSEVHSALADNFDTPRAIRILLSLIRETMDASNRNLRPVPRDILINIYSYVKHVFGVFGMEVSGKTSDVVNDELVELKSAQFDDVLHKCLDFRSAIRSMARSGTLTAQAALQLCDEQRNVALKSVGVEVLDKADGSYQYNIVGAVSTTREQAKITEIADVSPKVTVAEATKPIAPETIKPTTMDVESTPMVVPETSETFKSSSKSSRRSRRKTKEIKVALNDQSNPVPTDAPEILDLLSTPPKRSTKKEEVIIKRATVTADEQPIIVDPTPKQSAMSTKKEEVIVQYDTAANEQPITVDPTPKQRAMSTKKEEVIIESATADGQPIIIDPRRVTRESRELIEERARQEKIIHMAPLSKADRRNAMVKAKIYPEWEEPSEMFGKRTDLYKEFDKDGLPTFYVTGEPPFNGGQTLTKRSSLNVSQLGTIMGSKTYNLDESKSYRTVFLAICSLFGVNETESLSYSLQIEASKKYLNWPQETDDNKTKHIIKYLVETGESALLLKFNPSHRSSKWVAALNEGDNEKDIIFHLKFKLQEPEFAESFIKQSGMDGILRMVTQSKGNTQTYALAALRACLEYVSGMDVFTKTPALIKQLFSLVDSSVVGVQRGALELLFVLCNFRREEGFNSIHHAAKSTARASNKKPYANIIRLLDSGDLETKINAFTLLNVMLDTCPAPEKIDKLVRAWGDQGLHDKLRTLTDIQHGAFQIQLELYEDLANVKLRTKASRLEEICKRLKARLTEFELQQPLVAILKEELKLSQVLIRDAAQDKIFINSRPMQRYLGPLNSNYPVDLSFLKTTMIEREKAADYERRIAAALEQASQDARAAEEFRNQVVANKKAYDSSVSSLNEEIAHLQKEDAKNKLEVEHIRKTASDSAALQEAQLEIQRLKLILDEKALPYQAQISSADLNGLIPNGPEKIAMVPMSPDMSGVNVGDEATDAGGPPPPPPPPPPGGAG
eukprot:gene7633-8929_t